MGLFNFKTSTLFAIFGLLLSIGFLVIMSFAYNKIEDLDVSPQNSDYCEKTCNVSLQDVAELKRTLIIGLILSLLLIFGISAMVYFEKQTEKQLNKYLQEKLEAEGRMLVTEGGRVFVVNKDANIQKQIDDLLKAEQARVTETTRQKQQASIDLMKAQEADKTLADDIAILLKKKADLEALKAKPSQTLATKAALEKQIEELESGISAVRSEIPLASVGLTKSGGLVGTLAGTGSKQVESVAQLPDFTSTPPALNFPPLPKLAMRSWRR